MTMTLALDHGQQSDYDIGHVPSLVKHQIPFGDDSQVVHHKGNPAFISLSFKIITTIKIVLK